MGKIVRRSALWLNLSTSERCVTSRAFISLILRRENLTLVSGLISIANHCADRKTIKEAEASLDAWNRHDAHAVVALFAEGRT